MSSIPPQMYSYAHPSSAYYPTQQTQPQHALSILPSGTSLKPGDITLTLRQEPKEALITSEGKEKARKPVDPPPIIQLQVKHNADPPQHFLQSPYLFMCASLHKVDKDQAIEEHASKCLAGSLVSSLHRLKDIDNKDGAFFVFGDISVKVQGTFRLHFSLFDLHKDTSEVHFLASITSTPFKVVQAKDFKGLDESTYLSRAFSDQGVRLRLRKEPRAMMGGGGGNKRGYPFAPDSQPTSAPIRPNTIHEFPYADDSYPPSKRYRQDTEEVKRDTYSDHGGVSSAPFTPSYSTSQYTRYRQDTDEVKRETYQDPTTVSTPAYTSAYHTPTSSYVPRQPSIPGHYSLPPQYSAYGSLTGGNNASSFQYRSNINYDSPVIQPADTSVALQSRFNEMPPQNFSQM